MTLVSHGKGVSTLLDALCLCARSIKTLKMEKGRDFEIVLDGIPCGGLSQLAGVGGTLTPSL